MLRATESDAIGKELSGQSGITGLVGVGMDVKIADTSLNNFQELQKTALLDVGFDEIHLAEVDGRIVVGWDIKADVISFLDGFAADLQSGFRN